MKLHELKPAKGSKHKEKRLGRGEASGHGGTSTRGNKGFKSRSGSKTKIGHEGGQMPIQRRLPKINFKNINRIEYKIFNLKHIEELVKKYEMPEFSLEHLYLNKLINQNDKVKILAHGTLQKSIIFKVHHCSAKAKLNIENCGGSVEIVK